MQDLTKRVAAYVEKWTDILNLRDWRIKVFIQEGELPEMPNGEEAAACIFHAYEHHEAEMYILHPDNWHKINSFWANWDESRLEDIIIHELLHLHFTHYTPKLVWLQDRQELAINQLTNALLSLSEQKEVK